ncbi:MAG: cytochrome b/b6 domain-containing protein [Alphaproteobacteria bacterium]|nr:cytochrome b/b6 domain-containing protein [Alphaproteobacteria bacterium]
MREPAREHHAWDAGVRAFHWINLAALLWMTATGLCILYENELGLPGPSRVAFKIVHKWGGYVFAINLALRLVWGFVSSGHGNWSRALPLRAGFLGELRAYLAGLRSGEAAAYVGHNPLGALMVAALLLALVVQAVTGMVLAGTDLYQGPFGSYFAEWVAAPGIDPASLVPGDRTKLNAAAYAEMRKFRAPIVRTHEYAFYVLMALSALHIAGVVRVEISERVNVVSAMISGRKRLRGEPVDGR